jgi:hypothetical protein
MMPSHIVILPSILVGLATTLGTLVIHGFMFHIVILSVRRNLQRGVLGARLWVNLTFLMCATLLALAHLGEIVLWAFRARPIRRGRRYQGGHLFIGWHQYDGGFRHRFAARMEAAGTI